MACDHNVLIKLYVPTGGVSIRSGVNEFEQPAEIGYVKGDYHENG